MSRCTKRTSNSADAHEGLHDVRLCLEQFGELVDHHKQGWQRIEIRAPAIDSRILIFGDVRQVAGIAQQFPGAG